MREFDNNGLRLAEYQGKLFELSTKACNCSSSVFLRRFYYSNLLTVLDKNDSSLISLVPSEGLEEIEKQFGKSSYGKIKYSTESLFWMGYIYRYISYTRNVETKFIMRLFPPKTMNDVYFAYHTQSPEWCVDSLLELNHITEDVFDCNWRLKQVIQQKTLSL